MSPAGHYSPLSHWGNRTGSPPGLMQGDVFWAGLSLELNAWLLDSEEILKTQKKWYLHIKAASFYNPDEGHLIK